MKRWALLIALMALVGGAVLPEPVEARRSSTSAKKKTKKKRGSKTRSSPSYLTGSSRYSSCAQARAAGAAPMREGDPGYSYRLDRDRDGVACE